MTGAGRLKTSLDHLPEQTRRELEKAVNIVQREFAEAVAEEPPEGEPEILKIILYGSYARGGYVESLSAFDGYRSDFDLLVVVNKEDYADYVTCSDANEWFRRLVRIPVSLEAHGLEFVNEALSRHRPFFSDILKDGIVLYEKPGHPFVEPPPLTPELTYDIAKEHHEVWFLDGKDIWKKLVDRTDERNSGHLAIMLQRRADELYTAVLLVLTLYAPGSDLENLRGLAETLDERLAAAWPRDTPAARRRFDRFKRAFLKDASQEVRDFTAAEVAWIAERVEHLEDLVGTICEERLTELAEAAGERR